MLLRNSLEDRQVFGYGPLTLCGAIFHSLRLTCFLSCRGPTTPVVNHRFGLFRFRSPLLTESISLSFPRVTEMFHFTRYCVIRIYLFNPVRLDITPARLPHSEICGSSCICHSPQLIAAYHVLLRLLAPRHPLCALSSLIKFTDPFLHGTNLSFMITEFSSSPRLLSFDLRRFSLGISDVQQSFYLRNH